LRAIRIGLGVRPVGGEKKCPPGRQKLVRFFRFVRGFRLSPAPKATRMPGLPIDKIDDVDPSPSVVRKGCGLAKFAALN